MQETLTITKSLADGNRLRALMALTNIKELCVCQITAMLKLAPATVSRHMSVLQNAHMVNSRKKGRWVYYSISKLFAPSLLQWLKKSLAQSEELAGDNNRLKSIVARDPDELCKMLKIKRRCHAE